MPTPPNDAFRLAPAGGNTQGIVLDGDLTIPRAVGAIVRNTADNILYVSLDAFVPSYTAIGGAGTPSGIRLVTPTTTTRFPTIADALAAAVAGDVVLIGPGTYTESGLAIPPNVSLIGDGPSSVIAGAALTGERIVLATGSFLKSVAVVVPDDAAAGIRHAPAGPFDRACVENVSLMANVGIGIGISAPAGILDLTEVYFISGIADSFVEASGGNVRLFTVDQEGGGLTDTFRVTDGSLNFFGAVITVGLADTGLMVAGGQVFGHSLTIDETSFPAGVNNALQIIADDVDVKLSGSVLQGVLTDVLVAPGLTGLDTTFFITACEYRRERTSFPAGWEATATYLVEYADRGVLDDQAFRFEGEVSIGSPEVPSELVVGQGDSTTQDMVVLSEDPGNVFVDNTAAAASRTGSTFELWQGTAAANYAYFINTTRQFQGLKDVVTTALVLGAGTLVWEFWNGAAWTAFNVMTSDADAPHDAHAQDVFTRLQSSQIRFDNAIRATWATTTVNGTTGFAVRVGITAPITTVPELRRVKLGTDRTEINGDGFVEFFGAEQPFPVDLAVDLGDVFDTGTFSIAPSSLLISPSVTLTPLYNGLNDNLLAGVGIQIPISENLDTSRPLTLRVNWQVTSAALGDVELQVASVETTLTDTFDGTLAEVIQTDITTIAVASTGVGQVSTFLLDISDLVPGEILALALLRDAQVTNPNDTLPGNIALRGLRVFGTTWRE